MLGVPPEMARAPASSVLWCVQKPLATADVFVAWCKWQRSCCAAARDEQNLSASSSGTTININLRSCIHYVHSCKWALSPETTFSLPTPELSYARAQA